MVEEGQERSLQGGAAWSVEKGNDVDAQMDSGTFALGDIQKRECHPASMDACLFRVSHGEG